MTADDDLTRLIMDACAHTGLCVFPCDDQTSSVNDVETMRLLAAQLAPLIAERVRLAQRSAWREGWRQGALDAHTRYQTGLAMPVQPASRNPYEQEN